MPSCNVRYELYPFYNQTAAAAAAAVAVRISPPLSEKNNISSSIIIATVVPAAVCVMLLFVGCCFLRSRAKKKYQAVKGETVAKEIAIAESLQFDFGIIEAATDNFSDDNMIGRGGFGAVYKGTLSNGQEIAVKRLSRSSGQGDEFKNEVVLVAKL